MEGNQMSQKNWANILLLGFGFFLLFTAFQTSGFVQVHIDVQNRCQFYATQSASHHTSTDSISNNSWPIFFLLVFTDSSKNSHFYLMLFTAHKVIIIPLDR